MDDNLYDEFGNYIGPPMFDQVIKISLFYFIFKNIRRMMKTNFSMRILKKKNKK